MLRRRVQVPRRLRDGPGGQQSLHQEEEGDGRERVGLRGAFPHSTRQHQDIVLLKLLDDLSEIELYLIELPECREAQID